MIDRQHIVIVGGGFSGTALAVHLLRLGHAKLDVTLIEASSSIGHGIAYEAVSGIRDGTICSRRSRRRITCSSSAPGSR